MLYLMEALIWAEVTFVDPQPVSDGIILYCFHDKYFFLPFLDYISDLNVHYLLIIYVVMK